MQTENPTTQSVPHNGYLQEEEVHLSDYLNVLYRRRRIAIAAFLAVVIGVTFYTFLTPPIYEATATLHVKDEKVGGGGNLLGDLGLSRDNPIETEIEIVKSRTNIEEVVRRLHLNWVVDKKSEGLTFQLADFASAAEEPQYRLELTGESNYRVLDGDGREVAEARSGSLARGDDFTLLLDGLQGRPGDGFRLTLASFNRTVNALREAVRASEVGKGTNIIRLSYQNHDPTVARDVVNALAQAYLERSVVLKTMEASRSVEFIGQQLDQVRQMLHGAEGDLEDFKSKSGVVRLDAEAETLIERLSAAEKEQTAVRLRQRQAEFASDALRRALERQESYAPAILLDEPVVAALAQNLAQLEVERQGLLVEFAPGHPAVQAVQERTSEVQRKLLGNYESILAGLRDTDATLTENLARYEQELKKLPAAELELARLARLATVNAEIYTFLLQKQQEARIAKASTISNINVIDPAIAPEKPVKPQKKKNLLLGLIVGGMLGVGLAFFREYLDDSIKDADGAKRVLGLPQLGTIPRIDQGQAEEANHDRALITHLEPKSVAAEAFRSLRTSLHFATLKKEQKIYLVTSTFPGEGKTTVSANLATILAQTGKRTLLIGCDLRRPTLHALFDAPRTPGLTEILVGDAELDEAIHSTDIADLDFINAGTTPPNPAELLGSDAMKALLEALRPRYDHILLDAPPLLAVTDALLLTAFADLALFTLEAGRVPMKAAQRSAEILKTTQAPVAGFVLNDKNGVAAEYYGYYGDAYYGELSQGDRKQGNLLARIFSK